MDEAKWTPADRNFVVNPEVKEIFLQSQQFTNTQYTADGGDGLRNASMGRKWALDLYMDQNVGSSFTQASAATASITEPAAVGDSSITFTVTGTIAAGAKIKFTTSGEEYAVTAVNSSVATISPKIRVAEADNAAFTVLGGAGATYKRLPFFQREALAFVNRPLELPMQSTGVSAAVVSSGSLSLRAIVSYDTAVLAHKITLDILYGIAPLDVDRGGNFVY
jgi:hypothetical protein